MILLNTGKVLAFGYNGYGQLGDSENSGDSSNVPVAVNENNSYNSSNAIAIAAGGNYSMILLNIGKVLSFGYNLDGQLGDGSNDSSNVPVAVSTTPNVGYDGSNVIAISAGGGHAMILLNTGKVLSFGSGVYFGQLGHGSNDSSNVPVAVSTTPDVGYNGSNVKIVYNSFAIDLNELNNPHLKFMK